MTQCLKKARMETGLTLRELLHFSRDLRKELFIRLEENDVRRLLVSLRSVFEWDNMPLHLFGRFVGREMDDCKLRVGVWTLCFPSRAHRDWCTHCWLPVARNVLTRKCKMCGLYSHAECAKVSGCCYDHHQQYLIQHFCSYCRTSHSYFLQRCPIYGCVNHFCSAYKSKICCETPTGKVDCCPVCTDKYYTEPHDVSDDSDDEYKILT